MKRLARRILRKLHYFAFSTEVPISNVAVYNCVIGEDSRIYKQAQINNPSTWKANITIGTNSHIAGNLTVWANAGQISIGNYCFVGENTRIYSAKYVLIGDRVQIAHGCNIFDNNIHSLNPVERHKEYIENIKGPQVKHFDLREEAVIIKNDAWIGACVIILKGVTIGEGAIVGAGSVVAHDIPDLSVAVGNPARVVKRLYFSKTDFSSNPVSTGDEKRHCDIHEQ